MLQIHEVMVLLRASDASRVLHERSAPCTEKENMTLSPLYVIRCGAT